MKEITILTASILPKQDLINLLKTEIEQYENSPSDKNFQSIAFYASMVMLKLQTGDNNPDKAIEMIKRSNYIRKMLDLKKEPTKS